MAKVTIVGQAVVLESAVKLDDIKKLEKYAPEALVLHGGEDGKDPVFAVASGTDKINQNGVAFNHKSADGYAVTTFVTEDVGNVEEFVIDNLGKYLIDLEKVEAQIPAALEEVDSELENIKSKITVIGGTAE